MKKKIILFFFALIIISLGYLRDYVFVSINEKTGQGLAGISNPDQRVFFISKWVFTFIFAFIYLGVTCLLLHFIFARKKYIQIAAFAYGVLFLISFLAAAAGYFFSSFENVYPFVRTLMGIAQSPLVIMILIPAFLLNKHLTTEKKV